MSGRGYFFEKTSLSRKQNTKKREARNWHGKFCMFRIPWRSEFSTIEFLKGVAERVTKAMCSRSMRRSSNSNRVSSNSMGRSKSIGVSVDYHKIAAVEDCIEFMHSSFSRSYSSTTTPREKFMHSSYKKL